MEGRVDSDRERWNARYRSGERAAGAPDRFVLEALERAGPPGTALDLACGAGRHAVELARRGWRTAAWDVSDVALALCEERARSAGVHVATRRIDLKHPALLRAAGAFELVLIVDYMDRALFPLLAELVQPHGWLIYATFAPDWSGEKPSARHRIAADDLIAALPAFTPLAELRSGGRAGLLGRRPGEGAAARS
jgi:tellurite methyltransferase